MTTLGARPKTRDNTTQRKPGAAMRRAFCLGKFTTNEHEADEGRGIGKEGGLKVVGRVPVGRIQRSLAWTSRVGSGDAQGYGAARELCNGWGWENVPARREKVPEATGVPAEMGVGRSERGANQRAHGTHGRHGRIRQGGAEARRGARRSEIGVRGILASRPSRSSRDSGSKPEINHRVTDGTEQGRRPLRSVRFHFEPARRPS